ncbi:MAG: DUF1698 domain-containing protein [Candidatus Omnitrophica bacterium]|nr:DUF1698 domain-containing protein [Candidatus Omnitrophota bacterium]
MKPALRAQVQRRVRRFPASLLAGTAAALRSGSWRLGGAVFHLKRLSDEGYYHNISLSHGYTTYGIGGRRWNRQFKRDDAMEVLWRLIDSQIGSLKGRWLVDIGPAEGYFTLQAAQAGARVTAIQPSRLFVSRMRHLLGFHRLLDRVDLRLGCYPEVGSDAAAGAQVVFCLGLLYHLTDLVEALEPMRGSRAVWAIESIFHASTAPQDPSGITASFSPRQRVPNRPLCPVWLERHLKALGYGVTWLREWQAFAELPGNGRWQRLGDFYADRKPLSQGVTRRLLVARPLLGCTAKGSS